MNRLPVAALLGIFLLAIAPACLAQSADIATIKQLNEDWIGNYVKKDPATFERIFAGDFFLINPAGKRYSRADVLKGLAGNAVSSAKVDTSEVQIHGNIALIHARCSFTTVVNGKETTGQTDYLDVYEKRKGRWWAIAAHVNFLSND